MTMYLNDAAVESLLTYGDCIAVMEKLFTDDAAGLTENHPTVDLKIPTGFFRTKVGGAYGFNAFGLKAYGMVKDGIPRYLISLYNTLDGNLDAFIEAETLSMVRTGAVSALACKYMAKEDARSIGIIGTGREAFGQVAAIREVRPITSVRCWSRSAANRTAFAERIQRELGIETTAAESAESAVRGSDIVVTASRASDPVLMGAWLEPGQHICAIGATTLFNRELDLDAVKRSDLIVVENREQARAELGELILAQHRRSLNWANVCELKDVVSGARQGRPHASAVTMINTAGVGAEDVAVSAHVFKEAKRRGVGTQLPM